MLKNFYKKIFLIMPLARKMRLLYSLTLHLGTLHQPSC